MKPTLKEAPEGLIRKVLLGDDTVRAVRDADGRVTQYEFPGGGRVDAGTFECLRANGLVRERPKGFWSWIRPKGWEGRQR